MIFNFIAGKSCKYRGVEKISGIFKNRSLASRPWLFNVKTLKEKQNQTVSLVEGKLLCSIY